jgi:hypothetical protein
MIRMKSQQYKMADCKNKIAMYLMFRYSKIQLNIILPSKSWPSKRERVHSKDPSADRRIILKLFFEKWDGRHRLDRSGS